MKKKNLLIPKGQKLHLPLIKSPNREQQVRSKLLLKPSHQLLKTIGEESKLNEAKNYSSTPYDRMIDRCIKNIKRREPDYSELKNYPKTSSSPIVRKGRYYQVFSSLNSRLWLRKKVKSTKLIG